MGLSLTLTMPDLMYLTNQIETADEKVLEGWSEHADELLATEIYNVTRRTEERTSGPYSTGALASSVTGQAYPHSKNGTLIAVWFNSAQQYAAWNRYYAPYQEGSPLGLDTYTTGMHHMLYDSKTEDVDDIKSWAQKTGQQTADTWSGQLESSLPTITLGE